MSVAEAQWQDWLLAIGNMKLIRDMEIPMSLLNGAPAPLLRAAHYGLNVTHVQDLLPPEVARYLSEAPALGRKDVPARLKDMLVQCRSAGARSVSIEMGLDRIGEAAFSRDLAERVKLLRQLMPVAESQKLTLCVQVRHPRSYPGSKEWEYAGNLVHEVMHPCCRLVLNLVPAEIPAEFDVMGLVRSCYFNLGAIRIHYSPPLGECPDMGFHRKWAAALLHHGFKGAVIFCPHVTELRGIVDACRAIDPWANAYTGNG